MCGRYAAAKDTATLVEEFQVETVVEAAPEANYNVAPTDQVAFVVGRPVDGVDAFQRQLRVARWGLVPSWAKDPKIGSRMINARWENAADKPAFRSAFAKRRCLIPADGYFEWYTPAGPGTAQPAPGDSAPGNPAPGNPASGKPRKQPYFIHRADGSGLALAGLYEFWRPAPEEDWLVTVTVLTSESMGPLAAIHDRMPVIIEASGHSRWLDPAVRVGPDFDARLAVELLTAYPVGTAVNSVRNNFPELLVPIPAEPAGDGLT